MRCTNCGPESTSGRKFCAAWGSALSSRCPKCGAENAPSSEFCEDCGTALAGNAASAATSSSQAASAAPQIRITPEQPDASTALEGERKTVTALFADLKGSTELMEDLDPEEARAIVDPALKLMIEAVHRYDGYVVQSTGDGIFALFGAPLAHEDHPQRALHAAIAIQQQLRDYAQRLASQAEHRLKPVPLAVPIGINTGEVVLRMVHTSGHTEYTPVGHAANLAARMQTVAPAGGVLINAGTREFVGGCF